MMTREILGLVGISQIKSPRRRQTRMSWTSLWEVNSLLRRNRPLKRWRSENALFQVLQLYYFRRQATTEAPF